MECLSFGIRSLALAQAYRRLDVTRALDQHISTDLLELVSAPMLQRHAITSSLYTARKEAAETLSHLHEIARQDDLLDLDMLRVPGPGGPVQVLMRQCFMHLGQFDIETTASGHLYACAWDGAILGMVPGSQATDVYLGEARALLDSLQLD